MRASFSLVRVYEPDIEAQLKALAIFLGLTLMPAPFLRAQQPIPISITRKYKSRQAKKVA